MTEPCAILLMGPTASGKTDLALALADRLPCDLISVDSALIYRGMDIGTAKPSPAQLARYPHALVDICDPAERFSVGAFHQQALALVVQSRQRGRIPLLVGGTMMYFNALLKGLAQLPSAEPGIRQQLSDEARERGWADLHRELSLCDPLAAAQIHPHDPQRIQRALEVYRQTGIPLSHWWQRQTDNRLPGPLRVLALAPPERACLHKRIEQRFDKMLELGLVEEVGHLWQRGDLHADLPSIRSVGYRQIWQYLAGQLDEAGMREQAISATRQLAKRQLTWLRGIQPPHWLDGQDRNCLTDCLKIIERDVI